MRLLSLHFPPLLFHVRSLFSVIDCFMPRIKKPCMANEAYNGQIWVTCQCRGVKEEQGERERERERERGREGRKFEGERKKRGEAAEGRWPVPCPATEGAALASAGAAGIRWHDTRLTGCDWSGLDLVFMLSRAGDTPLSDEMTLRQTRTDDKSSGRPVWISLNHVRRNTEPNPNGRRAELGMSLNRSPCGPSLGDRTEQVLSIRDRTSQPDSPGSDWSRHEWRCRRLRIFALSLILHPVMWITFTMSTVDSSWCVLTCKCP